MKAIKRIFFLFLVNKIFVGTRPCFFGIKRALLNAVGYKIGYGTKVVGPFFCTGKLTIGENCWIGRNFTVNGNGNVIIGNNCDIAPDVTFLTGGHKIGDKERRAGEGEIYTLTVGNGSWIGARSTLLKNINVGNSVVVASCSCVINDCEDNTLVGGVPAKLIRTLEKQ